MALVILKIKPKVTKAILWSGSKTTLKIEPKLWMEIGKLKELDSVNQSHINWLFQRWLAFKQHNTNQKTETNQLISGS